MPTMLHYLIPKSLWKHCIFLVLFCFVPFRSFFLWINWLHIHSSTQYKFIISNIFLFIPHHYVSSLSFFSEQSYDTSSCTFTAHYTINAAYRIVCRSFSLCVRGSISWNFYEWELIFFNCLSIAYNSTVLPLNILNFKFSLGNFFLFHLFFYFTLVFFPAASSWLAGWLVPRW